MSLSFDNTLGALFIGFSVSSMLYGVFVLQVYIYCRRYPLDKVGYKAVVVLLFLLGTLHQALIGHSVYYYSITNFMNILALYGKPAWSLTLQLLIGSVVGTTVKFFFTIRVWRFSYGNTWLTMFLLVLTFGELGLAIAYTVKSFALTTLLDLTKLRVLGMVALGLDAVNNISVAIALCYYLQGMRCNYSQGNSVIRTLMLYAVNTGLVSSAMSFSTLLVYYFMPKNLIFVACYFVLSTSYAVSFVAALNTRQAIRGQGVDGESGKFTTSQIHITIDQRSQPSVILSQELESMQTRSGENATHSLNISNEFMRQQKPHYTVGW